MNNNITIGMDLGDKFHIAVVFDSNGNELETAKVTNTKIGVSKFFKQYKYATVAIEAGTHSPWISRLLTEMGLIVHVGNPRKLRLIWDSTDKSDARDARILGMVCRVSMRVSIRAYRPSFRYSDLVFLQIALTAPIFVCFLIVLNMLLVIN